MNPLLINYPIFSISRHFLSTNYVLGIKDAVVNEAEKVPYTCKAYSLMEAGD